MVTRMMKMVRSERGMAMLVALLAIVVIMGALLLVTRQSAEAKMSTDIAVSQVLLEEACKGGIDRGVARIWNDYVMGQGNTTGNLASYRVFIDDVVADGESAQIVTEDSPMVIDSVRNIRVTNVTLEREDNLYGTQLTITATATADVLGRDGETRTASQTARQTVLISGTPFTGFEYAVLANNINCILCHAGFRNLRQEYNANPDLYGTFDRVKVATLQALLFRQSSADSKVAGTVYTRGSVYNTNYTLMTDAQISTGDFKGYQFSDTNGKVTQDPATGAMVTVPLSPAGTDAEGRPVQFANLYRNYPTDPKLMTDGPMPESFPAPYPDVDGDRYVDDDEFEQIAGLLNGRIDGGIAYGVPDGQVYTGAGLPNASNGAFGALASTGRYDGNLILVGTNESPITLSGELAVNGDLIIKGKVKGEGQIFVRGNTYIVGDVTYADAPGQFGVAVDGTENTLGIITGGSVMMGDYLTVRGKNHTSDTSKYPNSALSIDVSVDHKVVNTTVNNVTQTVRIGYMDPGTIDPGQIVPTMVLPDGQVVQRDGYQFSFTSSELMLFNNEELSKAVADPTYVPRFYGLRDSQPNNIYVYTKQSEEHAVRYDEYNNTTVKTLAAYIAQKGYPSEILNRAAYHYMNPTGNWISEDTLKQIWRADERSRQQGDIWKFDGLLYSNNAIFALARSYKRHKSKTDGKMRVRGAIICPDIGVLVAGPDTRGVESFTMLYDQRVREMWAPQDQSHVFFQRQVYQVVRNED